MNRFDALAKTWDEEPARVARARAVARALVDRLDLSGAHVVDDGCGTGLLGFALLEIENVGTVTFIDPSEGMRDVVREKIADLPPQRACVLAPGEDLGGGRDLVASLMVLHHVPDPAWQIQHWTEWLAPGGHLAIADLLTEDGSFHGDEHDDVHLGFDPDEVAAWMREAGLEPTDASTAFTMEKTVDGEERRYPVWLLTGQLPPR